MICWERQGKAISAPFHPAGFITHLRENWSYISITADSTQGAFKPKWESRRKTEQKVTGEEARETKISTFDTSNPVKNCLFLCKSSTPLFFSPLFSIYGCLCFCSSSFLCLVFNFPHLDVFSFLIQPLGLLHFVSCPGHFIQSRWYLA